MITINEYTGEFQSSLTPQPRFRAGSLVRVHDSPDARQIDDFRRCLKSQGLAIDLGNSLRRLPRLAMDVYRVAKADAPRSFFDWL